MSALTQTLDRHQLKAIIRTNLILDWRGSTNPYSGFQGKTKTRIPSMVIVLGMNVLFSIVVAALMVLVEDTVSAIVLSGMVVMCLIAFQVILEFGNTIVS